MKSKKSPNLPSSQDQSILLWFIISTVILLIFFAAYHTALFNGYSAQYDKTIFVALLITSFIFILLVVCFFFNWELQDNRDLLSMYIWLVPLTFWISSLFAASSELAQNMTIIHVMYSVLFMAGAHVSRNGFKASLMQIAITMLGYSVVLYGLACAFGNMYSRDAVMFTDQGYRLTSVFQYANAYAAFLNAILLCCLYYITHSKKWYIVFINSLMLVPILVSFWLTLSRGGIVALPFIFLAILPVLSLVRQLSLSVYAIIGTAASFLITGYVTDKSTKLVTEVLKKTSSNLKSADTYSWFHRESLSGWAVVLGVSCITAGIIVGLQKYVTPKLERKLESFSSRKFSRVIIPLGLILVAVLGALLIIETPVKSILPQALQTRLENINFQQHSVLERGTFYKDSLKVFKEHPILGSGGGGWAALYERFQNNPYVSRQAHNFFLQYLIEVGVIGLAVFIGLLTTVYALFIRKAFTRGNDGLPSHLIFYFVSTSILIHSILDFEMSYVFLGALVFLCLGGMASVLDNKPSWMGKLSFVNKKKYIYPSLLSIIAIFFFYITVINLTANNSYEKAIAYAVGGKPLNEVLKPLDKAISSTSRSEYYALKSNFLLQVYSQNKQDDYWNQAKNVLEEARKKEPNNRLLLERQYSLYIAKQDLKSAISVIREGLENYPWELSFYERAASLYNTQWNQAKQQKNAKAMEEAWDDILNNSQAVQKGIEHIATLPAGQMQGRAFYQSSIIHYSLGQVYMLNGQYDKALAELQPASAEANTKLAGALQQGEDEQYRIIIRYYLALTQKLGNIDQALYGSFTTKYPQEKQQIEVVIASL